MEYSGIPEAAQVLRPRRCLADRFFVYQRFSSGFSVANPASLTGSAWSNHKADGHGLLSNAVPERMSGTKADCLWQEGLQVSPNQVRA